jgi:hypothetical protein
MPDFNPIKDAKNFQQQYVSGGRFTDEEYETGVGWLSDYIDALVKALRETDEAMHALDRNDIMQIVSSANVELLSHTNRHLLEG